MIRTQYERKFLIDKLPDLSLFKKETITQWYLTKPNLEQSIRIRKYDDNRCYVDVIDGFGKIRNKIGKKIDYLDLINITLTRFPSLTKTRYKKNLNDDILLVIDIFKGGLKIVEVETYKNEQTIDNFNPPKWFGKEITDDITFTNNWIAYNK